MQLQPRQYVAYPSVTTAQTTGITDIINAILPLMLVMMMGMIIPMMKGVTAEATR